MLGNPTPIGLVLNKIAEKIMMVKNSYSGLSQNEFKSLKTESASSHDLKYCNLHWVKLKGQNMDSMVNILVGRCCIMLSNVVQVNIIQN